MSRGAGPMRSRQGRWRHRDHTRGGLLTSLWVLSAPLLVSSLAGGVVFQLVDLGFLSRLGEEPMAAVIIANQGLRQFVMLALMGASFGAQALIARAVGEGSAERAGQLAGQVLLLGGAFYLVVALAGGFFPHTLFSLPGADASFYPYGVPYVRLAFVLSFGLVGVFLFNAILTGAGDTATPLFVQLLQTAAVLSAEWVLIFGHLGAPALGVRGVAIGAAIGQTAAMTLGLTVLFRGGARVHLRRRHLVPDPRVMREILALSWPPALHMMSALVTTFVFIRLAGRFGESVQAAYAIGLRLGMIVPAVCFPLATSCATLVGQSLGAGDVRRAWRAVGAGLLVNSPIMLTFALLTFLFRTPILSAFSDDPAVIGLGSEYLLYMSGAIASWAFYFVFLRALQGAGDVLVPMAFSLGNTFLLAIPLAYSLVTWTDAGPTGIWTAQLVSSICVTLATGAWLATGRWTRRAQTFPEPPAP